jgi:hypothetical protein
VNDDAEARKKQVRMSARDEVYEQPRIFRESVNQSSGTVTSFPSLVDHIIAYRDCVRIN